MEPLEQHEAMRLLEEAPVAHIGVISNGEPYVTPMSFVVDGNRILFRTKPGKRYEGMTENPVVSVEASLYDRDSGEWSSVIARGVATESSDPETMALTVELLMKKYEKALGNPLSRGGLQPMSGFPHVVSVEITEISGMSSGRGFTPRTRPGRL